VARGTADPDLGDRRAGRAGETSNLVAARGDASGTGVGRSILAHVDAPAGPIQAYTEVQLRDRDEKLSIPDGAVVIERGKHGGAVWLR
jgi:hypothetical protein